MEIAKVKEEEISAPTEIAKIDESGACFAKCTEKCHSPNESYDRECGFGCFDECYD